MDSIVRNYEFQLRHRVVSAARSGTAEEQIERFRRAQQENQELEMKTRAVLCLWPVQTWQFPFYYDFSRQVARLLRLGFCGRTLVVETGRLVEVWAVRGLDREVLSQVAHLVFNVEASEPVV